ncbi:MAG: hypothetical protein N3D73_01405 [Candidatus Diapherotrites archaeon]|nr:hypothetical protein [Candidatus Diapherotrites archaeon]
MGLFVLKIMSKKAQTSIEFLFILILSLIILNVFIDFSQNVFGYSSDIKTITEANLAYRKIFSMLIYINSYSGNISLSFYLLIPDKVAISCENNSLNTIIYLNKPASNNSSQLSKSYYPIPCPNFTLNAPGLYRCTFSKTGGNLNGVCSKQ